MKCKFSLLAPINITCLVLGLSAATTCAQQAAPAAARAPAPSHVRFWNMLAAKDAPTLQLLSAEDKTLATAQPLNYTASYSSLAPGSYTFTVRKNGDTTALKKQQVVMRPDTYITYLVSEKNNQTTVELIDDTLDPSKLNSPSRLAIREFIPGARVTVTTREGLASQAISYGETTVLDNLPHQAVFLTMNATGLGPEVKTWSTEADFVTYRHATLLIVTDPYGRFRPRLAYDGPTVTEMQVALNPNPSPAPR